MIELERCHCGGHAHRVLQGGRQWIECTAGCGWRSLDSDVHYDSVAAWNAVMRPRPVAEEKETGVWLELLCLGAWWKDELGGWRVTCHVSTDISEAAERRGFGTKDEARDWFIEKLRAVGFDVKEASGG